MAGKSWLRVRDVAGMDVEALRAVVRVEMAEACALRLRNATPVGDPLTFWRAVGDTMGLASDIVEDAVSGIPVMAPGTWMDVRFEPDRPDTYRHHKVGQPLHSDGAYTPREFAQEIALFYLERQARSGGESLFVDAATVAAHARAHAPGLYEALTTLPVHFGKAGAPGRTTTILSARRLPADRVDVVQWRVRQTPNDDARLAILARDPAAIAEAAAQLKAAGRIGAFAVFPDSDAGAKRGRAFATRPLAAPKLAWRLRPSPARRPGPCWASGGRADRTSAPSSRTPRR